MTYKLIKKYPSIYEDWKKGMLVSNDNKRYYEPIDSKYTTKHISFPEVENHPKYWKKVEDDYLFVTYDGKIIKEGDDYWFVWVDNIIPLPEGQKLFIPYFVSKGTSLKENEKWSEHCCYFSTLKSADKFVFLNKPCLFLNEVILEIQRTSLYFKEKETIINNLKELVKSK